MWFMLGAACVVLGIAFLFLMLRTTKVRGPFSVVLLRRVDSNLTDADVKAAFSRAFGVAPEVRQIPLPGGKGEGFLLIAENLPPMAFIQCHSPYGDATKTDELVASLESSTAREAIANHTCWIAVDAMGIDKAEPKQVELIHKPLARLAAEFYDDKCMLLLLRATDRVAAPGDFVETKLRQGRLDELFGDDKLHAPMYHVEAGDAAIERAKQEARIRLPEFLEQCRSRGQSAHALFKAGFPTAAGDGEFIWLSFSEFQGDDLVGVIENEPIDRALPRKGQSVAVKLDDVIDWAYVDENDQPVGIFVDRLLMKRAR